MVLQRPIECTVFIGSTVLLLSPGPSSAQQKPVSKGHVVVPQSSIAEPGDAGVKVHTNIRLFVPATGMNFGAAVQPNELPPFPGFFFETPASLGCIYHLVTHAVPGCNPNVTSENPNVGKGAGAIAVIEFFDDPTAQADLDTFSAQFGLPPTTIDVVYLTGTEPPVGPNGGFEIEAALDLEWAHAMAPQAKIILVESPNNSLANAFAAVQLGANLVAANGGGEVSMSFGTGEFSIEANFDSVFTTPGVVYLASSGDSPGVSYPSASPNVISAGGTTISRDPNAGTFLLENSWQDAGGGPSEVEPRPTFQNEVAFIVGNSRGTPDIAFDANPTTGVWVFDSNKFDGTGWFIVGGTSVSAPSLAGILNSAGGHRASSQAEETQLYNHILGDGFNQILFGNCGLNAGNFETLAYNFCSGLGTTHTLQNK